MRTALTRFAAGLFLVVCACTVFSTDALGQRYTHVRGYVRKDGTYVSPHYRTTPDGSFYNNWSTKGNINPFTGKEGTKTSPPAGYGSDVYVSGYFRSDGTYVPGYWRSNPDGDAGNNFSTSGNTNPFTGKDGTRLPSLSSSSRSTLSLSSPSTRSSHKVLALPPSSSSTDYDTRRRMEQAADLQKLGYEVDWHTHSWVEMYDMEKRIKQAKDLERLGVSLDWRQHPWTEMYDTEKRIKEARDLEALGLSVDWKKHSWTEMYDMEKRIKEARDLRALGINVDWQKYTWLQMYEMERAAKSKR